MTGRVVRGRVITLSVLVVGSACGLLRLEPAGAATLIAPARSPVVVPVPVVGAPAAVSVVASGFEPKTLVFVEQCDGVAPTSARWSPTEHCDLGSSPAPVVVDARGFATFSALDRNHAFRPFSGESPQSLFNCVGASQRPPENSLPTFARCTLRVSSNNAAATSDQAFAAIELTVARSPSAPLAGGTPRQSHTKAGAKSSGARPTVRDRAAVRPAAIAVASSSPCRTSCGGVATITGGGSSDLLALSDPELLIAYLVVALGLSLGAVTIALRRRVSGPSGPVTDAQILGER